MKKIIITDKIKNKFKDLVFSIFKKQGNKLHLIKKEKKQVKFDITLEELNKLIYKKLKKFDEKINFEKLIISDYYYIQKLVKFIDRNKKYTQLNEKEKNYFYTLYQRLKKVEFIEFLNVKTCLYCNRNFILNFKNKNGNNTTAQLDHFFNKRTYPYLAVSLYNLIPSCSTCNLRKSDKQVDILHPYADDIDKEIKFSLTLKNAKFYYSVDGFDINVIGNSEKAKSHIELFNLQALYNEHKDIILELIQKKYMYNESYLDELTKKYEGTLFKNKEDLMRLVSGGYISEDEINKRPLSKLIKDISEDLDLI
jgi:5-methylcytosine-specific restriction endonuclease McrA